MKVVNYRPLFYIFIFLLCGIACTRRIFDGDLLTILFVCMAFVMLIIWLGAYKKFKILCVLISAFILGGGLYFIGSANYKINDYSNSVAVVGRVKDNVKEGDYYYSIILDDVKIDGKADKNISLYVGVSDGVSLKGGDILAFETKLESISLWTLKNFNSYYYRNDIGYKAKVSGTSLTILEGGRKFDEKIRSRVKQTLNENMSSENAGLCYGVLFGDKVDIKQDTLESFKKVGIIHILAVSGLHVSFLLSLLLGIMKVLRVNKYVSFVFCGTFLIFFAYLCSFTPSVLRAGLMGIFLMLAKLMGRRYDTLSSLGLAGIIILLISPLSAFDLGFLMSVFCVIGISVLSKLFLKLFAKVMPKQIASALAVSLASEVVTLPFLAYFGGSFNLLSPFVNLIIVPFFGILFPYLFVTLIISIILPFMGFILQPASWGFSAITSVVKFLGGTSLYLSIEKVHIVVMLVFFVLIFGISKLVVCDKKTKGLIVGLLAFCLALFGLVSTKIDGSEGSVVQLYSGGYASYIVTSSSGQSLVVGYNDLLPSYSREYSRKKFDYYLSLKAITEEDEENLSPFGTQLYIACSGDDSCDNTNFSSCGEAGDFEYEFLLSSDKVLGVTITFDGYKIFIASSGRAGYNSIYNTYFLLSMPNVVFVDDNLGIEGSFAKISIGKSETSWASYEEEGNLIFTFNGKYVHKEVLD